MAISSQKINHIATKLITDVRVFLDGVMIADGVRIILEGYQLMAVLASGQEISLRAYVQSLEPEAQQAFLEALQEAEILEEEAIVDEQEHQDDAGLVSDDEVMLANASTGGRRGANGRWER